MSEPKPNVPAHPIPSHTPNPAEPNKREGGDGPMKPPHPPDTRPGHDRVG